jgi:hypothetical protein
LEYCETHKGHEDVFSDDWKEVIRRPKFKRGDGSTYTSDEYYPGLDYPRNSEIVPAPAAFEPEDEKDSGIEESKSPHKKTPWRSFFES